MQQQNEGAGVPQENTLPEIQDNQKHSSKRTKNKEKRDNIEINENLSVTEIRNHERLNREFVEDDIALINEAQVFKDNAPEVTFPVPADSNGILGSSEKFEDTTHAEHEDEKHESLQEIIEEISAATTVLCKEITILADVHQEKAEKYALPISSSGIEQCEVADEGFENESNTEYLYIRYTTWGHNIRSTSTRRPISSHPRSVSVSESSSGRSDRHGNAHVSRNNHSSTKCSLGTTAGSIFTSLKRKTFDMDEVNTKTRKLNETKRPTLFSIVSLPLKLFRSKVDQRVMEGHSVGNISKQQKEDCDDINDKIKKGYETKEASQYVVAEDIINQNTTPYRSWCSIM